MAALVRLRAWAAAAREADAVATATHAAADHLLPPILRRPPLPGALDPAAAAGLAVLDWAAVTRGRGGRAVRARLADVAALAAVGRAAAAAAQVASPQLATTPASLPSLSHLGGGAATASAAASPSPTPWMMPGGAVKGGGKPARTGKGAAARIAAAAAAAAAAVASPPTAPSGRTYTSRFRGVHQTFPTRRWEAQFRRAGKPTSLGCFDDEAEAARAYDKMQLWCELHGAGGSKGGITNFDPAAYEGDLAYLQHVSQDDLVAAMRAEGRCQAAARSLAGKRGGSAGSGGRGRGRGRSSSRGGTPGAVE